MKPETGREVLNQIIQNWWIIREKLHQLGFQQTMSLNAEEEFLKGKGKIARKLKPLIYKLGNPQEIREVMLRLMRRIPSLKQLAELGLNDLKTIEKECHHIYIRLNRWYGEVNT
jgi:hypothetical protein